MRRALGWFDAEPGIENPPVRVWRDWLLTAGVAATVAVDVAGRDGMTWRLVAALLGTALALAMLWRRAHPLSMVAVGFGGLLLADLASLLTVGEAFYLNAGAFVLVLVYALFRWGTTRQAATGLMIVLLSWSVFTASDYSGLTDAIGGLVVLLFAAVVGVSIRYRGIVRAHHVERARFHEREVLARELHDTIAHHVTAIAIQAQAGKLLLASHDLGKTADALEAVELEASRALVEMRSIVGTLRRRSGTTTEPSRRGVADLQDLAAAEGTHGPRIDVEQHGDLDALRPPVQAALYRVAQESITNAKRHAPHATSIRVGVAGDAEAVRLTITDNGGRSQPNPRSSGYGLVGMAERVTLLGGTLEAGPDGERGWTVTARIPRHGNPS